MMQRAASYVRMSTDEQSESPAQQRDAISRLAEENKYRIIETFEDLGISGDKTDKRAGFQQMMAAAIEGNFDAILVWDQDRFGRFDSMEFNFWAYQLREAQVVLMTVTDGLIDWSEMTGRMMGNIKQEGKHQYLRDLSRNVSRGMEKLADQGLWVSGPPPFGYTVADKRLQLGDPEDVALVKEIFRRYLMGESTRTIARRLSDRGIVGNRGTNWTTNGIKNILKNPRYCGYLVYNQRSASKYKDPTNPKGKQRDNPRNKWKIVENTHPAIVSSEDFEKVRELMESKAKKPRQLAPERTNALTGLLRCGQCNSPMHVDRSNGVVSYSCQSYHNHPGKCERYNVREKAILHEIFSALRAEYFDHLTADNMDRLTTRMRELLRANDGAAEAVRQQIEKVEKHLAKACDRLLEVDRDMVHIVQKRIRELEDQRDVLRGRLAGLEEPVEDQVSAIEMRVESAISWLQCLEDVVETDYDPSQVNVMLRQYIDKVEVHMERVPIGTKGYHRCNITGGVIYFQAGKVSRFGTDSVVSEQKRALGSLAPNLDLTEESPVIRWGSAKVA